MYKLTEVRCRLHTGGKNVGEIRERYTGQGLTYRNFESLQKAFDLFDGQQINLYRKESGGVTTYFVASWPKANGKIMDGVYEAEQTHPKPMYKGEREKFLADWMNGKYNARMAFEFQAEDVEELEVIQEVKEQDRTRRHGGGASRRNGRGEEGGVRREAEKGCRHMQSGRYLPLVRPNRRRR